MVLGDKEVESKTVTVEKREGNSRKETIENLVEKLKEEIKDKK